MKNGLLHDLRSDFHRVISRDILGPKKNGKGGIVYFVDKTLNEKTPAYSCADKDSKASVLIAYRLSQMLGCPACEKPPEGQTAGTLFVNHTACFLREAFNKLGQIRPGKWKFETRQFANGIARYEQYEHLGDLDRFLKENPKLKSALGGDYLITPDIVVSRSQIKNEDVNRKEALIRRGDKAAKLTPLLEANTEKPRDILHASISCKWTMRSDRAQNTRTEALNLIRNRKGRTPCITAVTFEPTPSRLASIAMGTGDIDCTYHGALYELLEVVEKLERERGLGDSWELLQSLVEGRRLRDISDLPFDLAI